MEGKAWGSPKGPTSIGSSTPKKWGASTASPWQAAIGGVAGAGGGGAYTAEWDSAIGEANKLVGKNYAEDLNRFAQEEITNDETRYKNELGAAGMRELAFRTDVRDDWTKRRTDASTKANIDAQAMEVSALDALTAAIEGASGYELENLGLDIEQAMAVVEALATGAETQQNWETIDQDWFDLANKYAPQEG